MKLDILLMQRWWWWWWDSIKFILYRIRRKTKARL